MAGEQSVALITGAGRRRVGRTIADVLVERGYAVAIHYHSSANDAEGAVGEYRARGGKAIAVQADLSNEAAVSRMADTVVNEFGRIDLLVNTAALWESKPLEQVTAEDVLRHFEVNTLGTFLCSRKVGLQMVSQSGGGLIVTMGDWAEVRPYTEYAAYFPSKGAIPALTRSLAVELGSRNPRVRVNCIAPGPVMLPDDMPPDVRQRVIDSTLVKREGSPLHIARAVLSFVDNDFLTGVCLPVDGGRTVFSPDSVR
jgi:pteridine reductase